MRLPDEKLTSLNAAEKRSLLARMLRDEIDTARVEMPLSYGQQAMWFLHELAPESPAYNVTFTARVRSRIDVEALRRSLQVLVDRHSPLRTTYANRDGKLVQIVHQGQAPQLEIIDANGWVDDQLHRATRSAYEVPFDLENGPVFRAHLFTRAVDDHVLMLTAHHIAIDGWSFWVLLREFGEVYAGEVAGRTAILAPLEASYADFVRHEAGILGSADGTRLWEYWRDQLAGELPVLDLPLDRARPPAQTFNGATRTFEIEMDLTDRLRLLARSEHTTIFTTMLAAYQVLLHRYSGQRDLLIGTPVACRDRAEFAGLVGDFVNLLVLRGNLSGKLRFRDVLAQARETTIAGLQHQQYPFPLLVNRLATKLDTSRSPIFQVVINYLNIQEASELAKLFVPDNSNAQVEVGGLLLEPYPMPQQEGQLDLMLQLSEAQGALFGSFQYNTDLFDDATIERMIGHFQGILKGIVDNPDQPILELPLLTPTEADRAISEWNATDFPLPESPTIHGLIADQARRSASKVAVSGAGRELTYEQLESRANQLAHFLRGRGIARGQVIGLALDRTPDLVVAMLAVLKSGAAYLPLDPSYPPERLDYMLHDARASAILTTSELSPDLPTIETVLELDNLATEIEMEPNSSMCTCVRPEDLAYIIYTSGSTGRPKGVETPHRGVVNQLITMKEEPGLDSEDIVLSATTVAFDPSVLEIFLPLSVGAKLVLAERDVARDGRALLESLQTSRATFFQATPVTFRMLLDSGLTNADGLRCLCGGEAMPADLVRDLLNASVELWNVYGPTETTIWATIHRVERAEPLIPVGRPIANTQVYVLDGARQIVPPGVVGELFIGGAGMARGYRNLPELSAERFVPNPFDERPGARLYRTGDLARYRSDGTLVVLGRSDRQVKVRGFRIELGEIEAVLLELPEVSEAVVTLNPDRTGGPSLAAYLAVEGTDRVTPATLRTALRRRLPEHMVPAVFVVLESLPRTPNGKVDHSALPAPFEVRSQDSHSFVPPSSPTELVIAGIWHDVLAVDQVSAIDMFFDLGGNSLQAIEVIAALEERLGVRPNPGLIQTQTLGQLAAFCDEMVGKGEAREPQSKPQSNGMVIGAMRRMLGGGPKQASR